MNRIRGLAAGLLICAVIAGPARAAAKTEYDLAREAFRRGDHATARLYFEGMLRNPDQAQYFAEAVYHLALIHDRRGEVIEFMDQASRYLRDHSYGAHAGEIMEMLLARLVKEGAYQIGARYLQHYEYLVSDGLSPLLQELGRGLIGQRAYTLADYALSFCPPSDTVKILRASAVTDLEARHEVYQTLQGPERGLYLAENQLLMADTVGAFMTFRPLAAKDFSGEALYRYTRLALLFDRAAVPDCAVRLRQAVSYRHKAALLQAIAAQAPVRYPVPPPADAEEVALCQQLFGAQYVVKEVPEGLQPAAEPVDAGDELDRLSLLRRQYPGNFLLDSLYAWRLVERGDHQAAADAVSPYLQYANAQAYARALAGLKYHARRDHPAAARNIILSNHRTPLLLFVLAECLSAMGHHAPDLFQPAMTAGDPDLAARAWRGYVLERYQARAFEDICALDPAAFGGDTALIRAYARSLARCGALTRADSLQRLYFQGSDPELSDLYGQYLIERRECARAAAYYDSLVDYEQSSRHEGVCYHRALAALLNQDMADALDRFREYTRLFPIGGHLHDAQFKLATLNFMNGEFDSAAVYYGRSAADPELAPDALENQLISYKKAGRWSMVISAGQALLKPARKEQEASIRFEIGYASLRAGRATDAIQNLQTAARLKPEPATYYWLGEAYLGKGDFAGAFHSFQKILEAFAADEMWVPTAQYKTGVVLELLDELDAAQDVYERIVKARGVSDPIGAEADGRLKALKQRL